MRLIIGEKKKNKKKTKKKNLTKSWLNDFSFERKTNNQTKTKQNKTNKQTKNKQNTFSFQSDIFCFSLDKRKDFFPRKQQTINWAETITLRFFPGIFISQENNKRHKKVTNTAG